MTMRLWRREWRIRVKGGGWTEVFAVGFEFRTGISDSDLLPVDAGKVGCDDFGSGKLLQPYE